MGGDGHLVRTGGPCTQAERIHRRTHTGRSIGTTRCVFTGWRAGGLGVALRGTRHLEAGCDLAADLVVTAGWRGPTGRGRLHSVSAARGSLPPSAQKEPQPASQAGRKARCPGAWGTWKGPLCVHGDLESTCLRARLLLGRLHSWSEQPPSGCPGSCPGSPDTAGPVRVCRAPGSVLDMTWFSLQLSEQTSVKLQKSI